VAGAQELQTQLETILEARKAEVPSNFADELVILNRAKASLPALVAVIEDSNDPDKLEEMLLLNDAITDLIKQVEASKPSRPLLALNGLRNGSYAHSDISSTPGTPPFSAGIPSPPLDRSLSNSSLSSRESSQATRGQQGSDEDDMPTTPRLDKGKGKAVHHEEPEAFLVLGEDEKIIPEPGAAGDENMGSPTDSRSVAFCFMPTKSENSSIDTFFLSLFAGVGYGSKRKAKYSAKAWPF